MSKTHVCSTRVVILGGLLAVSGLSVALAQEMYWRDSQGNWVTDSLGECVRSSAWRSGQYTPGCDPEPEKVEVSKFEAPEPPATPIPEAIALEVDTLFRFNSAELTPDGRRAVDEVAAQLKDADRIERITVDGYTDSVGPEAYNLKLSERRAAAIRDELVHMGLDAGIIEIRAHGEADPVASNDTPEGRQQNRRAVLNIEAQRLVTP